MRYSPRLQHNRGFTLIELIIGIVVLGIALTLMSGLIFPQARKTVDPIYQVRGAELANALLNEIRGKAFDEKSHDFGGLLRCDESPAPDCGVVGVEEADSEGNYDIDDFDDVDDYHGLTISGEQLNSEASYASDYADYQLDVTVIYDGNYDGDDDNSTTDKNERKAKRIQVKVTLPNGEPLYFAAYRSNF